MKRFLLTVLLVVPLFGFDSPKEYGDRTEHVGIEGAWRLTEVQLNGNNAPPTQAVDTFYTKTYTVTLNGKTSGGSYRIDITHKPSHLDLTPSDPVASGGKTVWHIYQIDGDTLRIARMSRKPTLLRPQGFKDKGLIVLTYKRVR